MQVVTPPNKPPERGTDFGDPVHIFLAGSIEMGEAEEWQNAFIEKLGNRNAVVLNPRREDWDSSWEQSITNEHFRNQVLWEMDNIEEADVVVFYFDPNTKSPITLLELGLVRDKDNVFVVCPEGFWRKGNVDIVTKKFHHSLCNDLDEVIFCLDMAWEWKP